MFEQQCQPQPWKWSGSCWLDEGCVQILQDFPQLPDPQNILYGRVA